MAKVFGERWRPVSGAEYDGEFFTLHLSSSDRDAYLQAQAQASLGQYAYDEPSYAFECEAGSPVLGELKQARANGQLGIVKTENPQFAHA